MHGRRSDARLADERRRPADAQRLSGAADRARLLRHLLGQAPERDHGARQGLRRLLDEDAPTASPTTPAPASSPARRRRRRVPISRFNVRSFITSVRRRRAACRPGAATLRGIAFDGGYGIREVAVSADGGKTWTPARLGEDLGKYSFREWQLPCTLAGRAARAEGARRQPHRPVAAEERAVESGRLHAQRRRVGPRDGGVRHP